MADVNMTDAPAPKAKTAKATAGTEGDKKRFEVKKVGTLTSKSLDEANVATVERGSSLGLGHCRRQLRHLPQPHHGPVHRVPG